MDWNAFASGKYLPSTQQKSGCTMSSQFVQILANQHNKMFHIIDHPDLVFELAKYNFASTQQPNLTKSLAISKTSHLQPKPKTSQTRKFHRHKSQQQLNNSDSDLQHSQVADSNSISPLLVSNLNKFSTPSIKKSSQFQKSFQMKQKINFQKDKQSAVTEKQGSNIRIIINRIPIERHSNPIEIQTLKQSKTPIVNSRLLTSQSNVSYQKVNQKQPIIKKSWKKNFQRKKYAELKSKLQGLIGEIQGCQELKFSQVFEYEQMILRDYLSSLVSEMKKECTEKGELIEMIWNTFFVLINKVMKLMVDEKKTVEKQQVQEQLNLHSSYQQMYLFESTKIKQLGKKYNDTKNVIDKLIYQLRYKRKQVKKLSKTLAICNEKLNEYKVSFIDLQNDHIGLLIDTKQINREEALEILRRKIEVMRLKYKKEKVGLTKLKLKEEIEMELEDEKLSPQQMQMFKKQLFSKINQGIPKVKKKFGKNENKSQTHIIEEFIEQFSMKYIEPPEQNRQGEQTKAVRKPQKASTAINTEFQYNEKCDQNSASTQTSFSDKILFDIINSISTQTPGTQKIKKVETTSVQVDGDNIKLLYTRAKMRFHRAFDHSFCFQITKNPKLNRKSSNIIKKQSIYSKPTSELSSDMHDIKEISSKQHKNERRSIFEKKSTILNSTNSGFSNFRTQMSKFENGKKRSDSKNINKKRVTDIANFEHMKTQQDQPHRRQDKGKKRTYQSSLTFQKQKSRGSVSLTNSDSNTGIISMNEQKEKYIENFIMNKEQQFAVLHENAIMETFKSYLKLKNNKKSQLFLDQKNKIINSKIIGEQSKNNRLDTQEGYSSQKKQEIFTSFEKITSQNGENDAKRSSKLSKQSSNQFSYSLKKLVNENSHHDRQSLNQQYFLNKIIEFTVKMSLIKKKIDSSNFFLCKQKSQLSSITEKLDPFMLDVDYLTGQNLIKKRKQNLINFKSVNRVIMMTYSRSIDKMYRSNALLQNLIKPLFQCFQVIYGALKPQDIYKKMVSAISDIMSVKQNDNFKEFIFFLGLDKESPYSPYLTTFDVCLYLKLLERLNLGGKFGPQTESFFTSRWKVSSELTKVLEEEKLSIEVIGMVEDKITQILNKLQDYIRESLEPGDESKINLFKVSKIIIEEIIKLRMNALKKLQKMTGKQAIQCKQNTTLQNLDVISTVKSQYLDCEKVKKVVDCCRISTSKKLYLSKILEELGAKGTVINHKRIKKSELGILLIRIGLVDFSELQSRIKMVEEFKSRKSLTEDQQSECLQRGIQKISKIEIQSNRILYEMIGQVETIYELSVLKALQNKGR